ncbi:MAG: hypothetical protein H7Y38_07060 [Armatimonadetes bacterium]|nr:hypothetical protein [Armatimonadota bacterium]
MTSLIIDETMTEEQAREALRVLLSEIAAYDSRFHPYAAALVRDYAARQAQTKRETRETLARLNALLSFLEAKRIASGTDFDREQARQDRNTVLRKAEEMMLKAKRRFADA